MEATSLTQHDYASLAQFSTCLQHEQWSAPQLRAYQAQALRACRAYAYAHSPFYQRFHRGLMDRPLRELPVLTKAMLMEHFDELVTDRAIRLDDLRRYLAQADRSRLYLDRYLVTLTSGSTGQPGIFLYDPTEAAIDTNSFTRSLYWAGVTPESRAAMIGSTDPDQGSAQIPVIANEQEVSRLQLSANDPMDTLVQRLNDWQPDVLFGYPSIISTLAEEQRQGRLRIAPRVVGCAAETLTSERRQRIESAWQTQLFNVYGTTEGGALAAECDAHQGLHLFADFSLLEIVDQDNRPVPPGEQGARVLLTVLFRRTQPLIRYELTDLARTSTQQSCSCGRPFRLIESVEGRSTEVLYLSTLSGSEEPVSAIQFEFVFDPLPISGWQVVQEPDGLHLFLTGTSETLSDEQVCIGMQQMLSKRGIEVPPLAIHRVPNLARNGGGKAPRLISHLSRRAS